MTLETAYKKLLEKIITSDEFSHSKIYQTYLTYLVESSLQGRDLKETVIAMDVFGKNADFNPAEDTIVRSHTYTLRKKLESYYFHEGKDDKYRLKIPKGHYITEFLPVSEKKFHPKNILAFLTYHFRGIIIAVLAILLGLFIFKTWILEKDLKAYHIIGRTDPIWKDYLQSDLPILIVVGDHFFFNDPIEKYGQILSVRHPQVNSVEDFQALYPEYHLTPASEPYFPYHSIWSLPPILSILFSAGQNPILRKSSDVSPQILDEYNIIFLGSIKTLYQLKHTLLKSHFIFEISPHRVFYMPPDSGDVKVFETSLHSVGPNEDLVLVIKLPGPDKNSIFIIASYHSLGAPEIAKYLTAERTRTELEQKFTDRFNHVPQYFEILFRVTGIDKTAYNTEILIYNEIMPDPK